MRVDNLNYFFGGERKYCLHFLPNCVLSVDLGGHDVRRLQQRTYVLVSQQVAQLGQRRQVFRR